MVLADVLTIYANVHYIVMGSSKLKSTMTMHHNSFRNFGAEENSWIKIGNINHCAILTSLAIVV
jgi:hypothetical protein